MALFLFPIFHISSVSHRNTLTPASLTTGIVERGVNFFFFPKYDVCTDWKGLDQALLRGRMTQSMAGLITRKLQSQERHVLQDLVVLQVGGMCGKYER